MYRRPVQVGLERKVGPTIQAFNRKLGLGPTWPLALKKDLAGEVKATQHISLYSSAWLSLVYNTSDEAIQQRLVRLSFNTIDHHLSGRSRSHNMTPIPSSTVNTLHEFMDQIGSIYPKAIFRGQGDNNWLLRSSLDRHINHPDSPSPLEQDNFEKYITRIVSTFSNFAVGRLLDKTRHLNEDQLLSIAQHYGVNTPLLDWTEIPFYALFFALASAPPNSTHCAIHILNLDEFQKHQLFGAAFSILHSTIEENPRLVQQRGCFTRLKGGGDLITFLSKVCAPGSGIISRIDYPLTNKKTDLIILESMNISYRTIFPDLDGVARYCNQILI